MLRRVYTWVLTWADRPGAVPILGVVSFAESSIFPVPPDPLLMALCLGNPKRSYYYALVTSICSILGGMAGYAIGFFLWQQVGDWFFAHVPGFSPVRFEQVSGWYHDWDFWAVFTAGFTPIPYKIFTIAGGVFAISFPVFVLASAVSRSARFFLEAALLKRYGTPMQAFIERNLGWLSLLFVALLLGGFLLLKH